MGRLRGKRRLLDQNATPIDRLLLWQEPGVDHALKMCRRPVFAGRSEKDVLRQLVVNDELLKPNAEIIQSMLARSDIIIDEAIAANPALARKSSWVRSDDGMFADAALVAEGDDRPCFNRQRLRLSEAGGGSCKRIVLSTDCNEAASLEMAASTVATIRIVQQWEPIEVWWQGAWLSEDRRRGYVFHVPLVQGDMDFTKVLFFLASKARDSFSWMLMATESVARGYCGWNHCQHQAKQSYLPNTDQFIDHKGIPAQAVECYAASWLGVPASWHAEYEQGKNDEGALQKIAVPKEEAPETPEAKAKREASWEKYREDRKREDAERARARGLN